MNGIERVALATARSVPTAFAGGVTALAVLVLLAEFMMLRTALMRSQVRLYAAQSLVVVVLTAVVAAGRGAPDLYALAAASLLLKVIAVPGAVLWMLRPSGAQIAGSAALGVSSAVLLSLVVAGFGFFVTGALGLSASTLPITALGLAVAVVVVAFVVMVVRRDVVSQAVGFFSLENGIAVASLVVGAGMPLILEVVLLFDLLVAAVAFGLVMRTHHRRAASLSTASLDRLRG